MTSCGSYDGYYSIRVGRIDLHKNKEQSQRL